MDIEQTISALESSETDPVPVIESLIETKPRGMSALLKRLEYSKFGERVMNPLEWIKQTVSNRLILEHIALRRIMIALGALRAQIAIPTLLEWLIKSTSDRKLSLAASWSLANIGEAAVLPLFLFSRSREIMESARSLAIVTLGYIADPRIPSIMRGLWQEYRLEMPNLVIATLIGLTLREGIQEARKLAFRTEQLWNIQVPAEDYLDNYWENLKLRSSIPNINAALEKVESQASLPAWTDILRKLESE